MNRKKISFIVFTIILIPFLLKAQTNIVTSAKKHADSVMFNTSRLQWSAVELNDQQYKAMYHQAKNIFHMHAVVDQPNFSVFAFPNGSLFELYGPGSPARPWKNGTNGFAVGFAVDDIQAAIKELKNAGDELLGDVQSAGPNYKYQFFRAPDGRVYAISQSK
ncbi:VOC family protein [Mucilaginibacter sp. L196]|uniref:VOC family protein n=1 Tax=Mucilaginibacter sp. L196 TaxID=1641870 RepID=UPI00131ADEB8|nr:hypothetical protein [Mucilaginibacter sp. L196]